MRYQKEVNHTEQSSSSSLVVCNQQHKISDRKVFLAPLSELLLGECVCGSFNTSGVWAATWCFLEVTTDISIYHFSGSIFRFPFKQLHKIRTRSAGLLVLVILEVLVSFLSFLFLCSYVNYFDLYFTAPLLWWGIHLVWCCHVRDLNRDSRDLYVCDHLAGQYVLTKKLEHLQQHEKTKDSGKHNTLS